MNMLPGTYTEKETIQGASWHINIKDASASTTVYSPQVMTQSHHNCYV